MRSIEEGWLKPQISQIFPLEDAIAAHQLLENRNNMGNGQNSTQDKRDRHKQFIN